MGDLLLLRVVMILPGVMQNAKFRMQTLPGLQTTDEQRDDVHTDLA
jgi:hypothetical protein